MPTETFDFFPAYADEQQGTLYLQPGDLPDSDSDTATRLSALVGEAKQHIGNGKLEIDIPDDGGNVPGDETVEKVRSVMVETLTNLASVKVHATNDDDSVRSLRYTRSEDEILDIHVYAAETSEAHEPGDQPTGTVWIKSPKPDQQTPVALEGQPPKDVGYYLSLKQIS